MSYFLLHALLSTIVGSGLYFVWYDLLFPRSFPVDRRGQKRDKQKFYGQVMVSMYILAAAYDFLFVKTAVFYPYLFGLLVWATFALMFLLTTMAMNVTKKEKGVHIGFALVLFTIFAIMTQLIRVYA